MVVLVFLQSWRATLIPLAAVPVAIVGAEEVLPAVSGSKTLARLVRLIMPEQRVEVTVDDVVAGLLAEAEGKEDSTAGSRVAASIMAIMLAMVPPLAPPRNPSTRSFT